MLINMTERLELSDAQLVSWTTAGQVAGHWVRLERSAFFPGGGGQLADEGTIHWDSGQADILEVVQSGSDVLVRVHDDIGPHVTSFTCHLNASRRHMLMRTHTAFHVLIAILGREDVLVTGCNLEPGYGRGDFTQINSKSARQAIDHANTILREDHPVTVEWIPRSEFDKDPGLVRLATDLVPHVDPVRVINIQGIDRQADGGAHVGNTRECGQMAFESFENKGARNKRVSFRMVDE